MYDIEIILDDRPGELARMGEALSAAEISIEGGGMFLVNDRGVAHFLFEDGRAARAVLEAAGMFVASFTKVLTLRLDQERAGQLGALCRKMADAGVNIEILYSDHHHRLVLVVDDRPKGELVAAEWMSRSDLPHIECK